MHAAIVLSSWLLAAQLSNDPARAVSELQAAIRANPLVEENYTQLGNLLLSTQNFREAIVVLEYARTKFPASAQAALSLGVAYYGARRFEDAVKGFVEASKLAPDVEQPVLFLGRIWEHAGEHEAEVVERFRAYSLAAPRSALGHFLLGKATGDEGELRKSIALRPTPDAHFELGQLLETQGKAAGAIVEFEKCARLAPKFPAPHFRLFRLYTRLGQKPKAEAHRALHAKLEAAEKAEADRRQAATKHLDLRMEQP
ncbi:MAG: tetratricopeptide repeat protein [Acidobacteriota bacterium]|jgi:tetratricopeptide (TPR) repeat protein